MLLAQFGSSTVKGRQPLWLAGLLDARINMSPQAKRMLSDAPWAHFENDGYGSYPAPLATTGVNIQGLLNCTSRLTVDEFERAVRRYVGVRDWLVGYRFAQCSCGACNDNLACCHVCGRRRGITWYAKRARLQEVSIDDAVARGSQPSGGTVQVRMSFEESTPWQAMGTEKWAWGVPAPPYMPIDQYDTNYDPCVAPGIVESHWPCELSGCAMDVPLRFYKRMPASWKETYCIGYWSAGRWIRASVGDGGPLHVGGDALLQVAGDTWPLSRLAFTNFTTLTVTICSPLGYECSFTLPGPVGEPQYALVTPGTGAEVRFCPIHDDPCLDLVPAEYIPLATKGARLPVTAQTCPLVGVLWPGLNRLTFTGFRLPGHPFHYSYDIVPQYV